jgi:hypothetical protein
VLSKIAEAPEAAVKHFSEESDPTERVACALECLPATASPFQNKSLPFLYWKVRDYVEAYTTGRVTPTQVSEF